MRVPYLPPIRPAMLMGVAVIALAACAGPATTPSPAFGTPSPAGATPSPLVSPLPSASPPATTGATLLLEVTSEGGFINPVVTLSAVPAVVVESDGRIYTPAAVTGDAPFVAPVDVRDTGAAGAAAILAAIHAAGLDTQEAGGGVATDAGKTVFTVEIDGQTIVNRFVANGGAGGPGGPDLPGGGGPGTSPAADDPAARAFDLLAKLADPAVAWGAGAVAASPYVPGGYRVYAGPSAAGADASAVPWPLAGDLPSFGTPAVPDLGQTGLRSGVVMGADATTLASALAKAAAGTTFTSGGQAWSLWVRPLLPDELGG